MVESIGIDDIIEGYEAVLIDAYGVLVHSRGAIEGADEFLDRLRQSDTDYLVVTNDASRRPASCARRYRQLGVDIDAERVLTSGLLISEHLRDCGIVDAPVVVLGTEDSKSYLRDAGYRLVDAEHEFARAVVICDESGYDFVDEVDATLSMLVRALEAGRNVELVCPNPDCLYPKGSESVGFTAGAIAALFETSLRSRFPGRSIQFARLGKPNPALFRRAIDMVKTNDAVMLGDQLGTDIRGARAAGLDAVLVTTGIGELYHNGDVRPDFVLSSLSAV